MIVALAIVCFVVGFGVALATAEKPSKSKVGFRKLLGQLGLLPKRIGGTLEDGDDARNISHSSAWDVSNLLTKEQIESDFESSSWQYLAYQDFKTTILAKQTGMKTFPCIYATMGYRAGEHRYVFLKSDNPAEPQNVRLIAPALRSYLEMAPQLGPNTSLVIVGKPSEKERMVEEYNNTFWEMLRGLRITDAKTWPKDVPEKVESEKWTFCFNGEPIFPVMLTPAHQQRWSRHMSVPLIAIQPKWVLDKLLSTPERREAATGKVRKLLKEYDQIEISKDLTSYGQPGTTEARQLCLLDNSESATFPYTDLER